MSNLTWYYDTVISKDGNHNKRQIWKGELKDFLFIGDDVLRSLFKVKKLGKANLSLIFEILMQTKFDSTIYVKWDRSKFSELTGISIKNINRVFNTLVDLKILVFHIQDSSFIRIEKIPFLWELTEEEENDIRTMLKNKYEPCDIDDNIDFHGEDILAGDLERELRVVR